MRAGQNGASSRPFAVDDVQYLVLPDAANPYLLARVRWPDVFEAISPVRPDWQVDPGLFDLPYDPKSTRVTPERAAAIAAEWGAQMPFDDAAETPKTQLVRRMPANWSDMSRAERRAWSIEPEKPAKPERAAKPRTRAREIEPQLDPSELLHEELITDFDLTDEVIDLTSLRDEVALSAEDV